MAWTKAEGFDDKLDSFIAGCQLIVDKQEKIPRNIIGFTHLVKRVRVHSNLHGAHCFVDFSTGDILKAASWQAPAKHARGNIFDEHNGLKDMTPYGPKSLRC